MMKLWRRRAHGDDNDDDGDTELDMDLESGFGSDTSSSSSLTASSFGRSAAEERRRLERELILTYDTRELKRGEAWFLLETSWLDAWMAYILSEDDPDCPVVKPGALTNYTLFDPKEYCLKTDLVATKHYRGVNPQVYALYAELYGTAGAKPIARWTLDIYATPVMIDDVKEMLHAPELKARVEVTALNDRFASDNPPIGRTKHESLLYRCCCRCEYLVPCLYRLLGGGPTYKADADHEKKQRKRNVSRRRNRRRRSYDYDQNEDDDDDEEDSDVSEDEIEKRGLLG